MKSSPLVGPRAATPAQSTTSAHRSLDFRQATSSQRAGGWVPGHCYSVPYMKIPVNNQVIFIKNVVAVDAYRSCRLWRWVKMPWIHYVLCHHHWTQCRHALSNTRQQLSGPPDSCTPMKLKALGPHEPSHGRTDDQLECKLPWQSPRSIGLCGSSWYPWCCGSRVWTYADGPPGFFQSPVCIASTV